MQTLSVCGAGKAALALCGRGLCRRTAAPGGRSVKRGHADGVSLLKRKAHWLCQWAEKTCGGKGKRGGNRGIRAVCAPPGDKSLFKILGKLLCNSLGHPVGHYKRLPLNVFQ